MSDQPNQPTEPVGEDQPDDQVTNPPDKGSSGAMDLGGDEEDEEES